MLSVFLLWKNIVGYRINKSKKEVNKNIKEGMAILLVTPSFSGQKNELCIISLSVFLLHLPY